MCKTFKQSLLNHHSSADLDFDFLSFHPNNIQVHIETSIRQAECSQPPQLPPSLGSQHGVLEELLDYISQQPKLAWPVVRDNGSYSSTKLRGPSKQAEN